MRQKFRMHSFVKVVDRLPDYMSHFDSGFVGIVKGSYSQIYGGNNIHDYVLAKVEDGRVVAGGGAWYAESHMMLFGDQDRGKAEEMLEDFEFLLLNSRHG